MPRKKEISKNWNDLSMDLKQKIIGKLDFVDRVSMQLSSKSDLEIVRDTPFYVPELRLERIFENRYIFQIPGCIEAVINKLETSRRSRSGKIRHDYILYSRRARRHQYAEFNKVFAKNLRNFLQNPKITYGTVLLDDTFFESTNIPTIIECNIENLKIRKSNFQKNCWILGRQNGILRFLHNFRGKFIRRIFCDFEIYTQFREDDVEIEERNGFDEEWFENLEEFRLPVVSDVRPSQLSKMRAKKIEIYSHFLGNGDVVDLLKRWDSEDVDVGSSFQLGFRYCDFPSVSRWFDNFQEMSENSGRIPMKNVGKEFLIWRDRSSICCDVKFAI